jgi:hypothetical protein
MAKIKPQKSNLSIPITVESKEQHGLPVIVDGM